MQPRISFDDRDKLAWELVQKCSTWNSVNAQLRDPRNGIEVTGDALRLAYKKIEILELLLSRNIDPNLRSSMAQRIPREGLAADWMTSGISAPSFRVDLQEWCPLQLVAYNDRYFKEKMTTLMTTLLNRGADVYAVIRQPMWSRMLSLFPDEIVDQGQADSDTEWDELDENSQPTFGLPKTPLYGLRSIVHAILEDGAYCQPLLSISSTVEPDVEHRDPQGRTLLLALGADAAIDGVLDDTDPDYENAHVGEGPLYDAFTNANPTSFEAIQNRGANVLAVDQRGKSALHHLLEAHGANNYRAPVIRKSLQHVLAHFPILVNQKDHQGMHPLCSALQRLRRYAHLRLNDREDPLVSVLGPELEPVIQDMLDAGADPLSQDMHGNSALHYIAVCGLGDRYGVEWRRGLFRAFIRNGVDINARNHARKSALELLLRDADNSEDRELDFQGSLEYRDKMLSRDIDAEVFAIFDAAGVRWTERNADGQTLLHVVAKYDHTTYSGPERIKLLLAQGLDPLAKDHKGETAISVAETSGVPEIIELLKMQQTL